MTKRVGMRVGIAYARSADGTKRYRYGIIWTTKDTSRASGSWGCT